MPKDGTVKKKFDKQALRDIGRYAAGMGAAALLSSIILQLDKILVSKMVSPSQFGYYMVASNVATLVYNASLPMYMSIFPHFAKLVHDQDIEKLKKDFHFYTKLLCTILLPFSAIVFFAAEEILWLWTKDKTLAYSAAPILQIMIIGTTLNALITPVHTLLLAYNRVRFMLYSHLTACILMFPLTLFLVHKFGVKGGAFSIAILYAGYFFIQGILIFRNLKLKNVAARWYIRDVLQCWIPVSLVTFLSTRYWLGLPDEWSKWDMLAKLSAIGIAGYIAAIFSNSILRRKLLDRIAPVFRKKKI